jgi:hypothetical protein
MNYEEKYPTLNSVCYSTKHKPKKSNFPNAYKVVTESGDIVEYYSENSRFDQKGIVAKEFIVTRQRALVDFNVEFAVVGKYKDTRRAGTLWYRFTKLDHDFISFKI